MSAWLHQSRALDRARTLGVSEDLTRLIRFGLVGICNTAVTLASYAVLVDGFGAFAPVASAIGFALGAVNGYVLNSRWTFAAQDRGPATLARYIAVQGMGALMSAGGVRLGTTTLRMQHLAAEIAILPLVTITTYALSRRVVFRVGRAAAA